MLRIGIIGLDSSHAVSFARWVQERAANSTDRIVGAWAGGSADAPLSAGRVEGFTRTIKDQFGIKIFDTVEEVAERSDALAIMAMDGRTHADLFKRVAPFRRPVFITKPLACDSAQAEDLAREAERNRVRWFSASALRFAGLVVVAKKARSVEVGCALWFEPANHGWFWYGVHGVEMVYARMGPGVARVSVKTYADREELRMDWRDGRHAKVVGWLSKEAPFSVSVENALPLPVEVSMQPLEQTIFEFFKGAESPVSTDEMLEVVRCLEGANRSRAEGGRDVLISPSALS